MNSTILCCAGCVLMLAAGFAADAAEVLPGGGAPIRLWEDAAPLATGAGEGHTPTVTPYLPEPDRATGSAIVVCPGGGYQGLALGHEGEEIGQWLKGQGIAAFILRYRHAPLYQHPAPLTDVRRAVRLVRARAETWGIDPARIGVLGFSAGGHLTATSGTLFEEGQADASDPFERVSSRPDFLVLLYPVIMMDGPHMHAGSRQNLMGNDPDPALIQTLSPAQQVTEHTPPSFLVHSVADTGVPVENSIAFFQALRAHGVPVEMHIFDQGPHGFGLATNDPVLSAWPKLCIAWLKQQGLLR